MLALLLVAPIAAHADLKADLQAKYRQLDQALARKDVRAVEAWVATNTTADFSYVSHDKHLYKRDAFLQGLREQIAATRKVSKSSVTVLQAKAKGASVAAIVGTQTSAVMNVDGQALRLEDKSRASDTWVKVGKGWRLKQSVQTESETQMYPT